MHGQPRFFLMPISPSNLDTMMQPFHVAKVPFSAHRSQGCACSKLEKVKKV